MSLKNRLISSGIVAVIGIGGAVGLAAPASASAVSTAFSNCMAGYTKAANELTKARQDQVANAVQLTGFTNCYYALSQRSDITYDQELAYIAKYEQYEPQAERAILTAGVVYYNKIMKSYSLKGLVF
jgi:hypothetical protein